MLIRPLPLHRRGIQHRTSGQTLPHPLSKLRHPVKIIPVRTPCSHIRKNTVPGHKRTGGHNHKPVFRQNIVQLQQSILIIAVAIHHHSHTLLPRAPYAPEPLGRHGRQPSAIHRGGKQHHIIPVRLRRRLRPHSRQIVMNNNGIISAAYIPGNGAHNVLRGA
ncbi:hypothetical protein IMSAGC006_00679 [Muribaculaceae bacterium]|nr:hypothetical protein IMSAGC006_00679 [Muribaculaceae bacterium]